MSDLAHDSFDLIVCSMALMNVERLGETFIEFARVLDDGGRTVFSIPHPCYPRIKTGRGVFRKDATGEEWLEDYRVIDYYTEGPHDVPIPVTKGGTKKTEAVTFHRTLTTYVSLLARAGFVVDGLLEPRPPDTAEARSELGPGWFDATSRIPYYLVLGARKVVRACKRSE